MRFGYCLNLQFLEGDATSRRIFEAVCESGFEYVELPMFAMAALSPDQLTALKKELADKNMPCLACNVFFPQSIPIIGPERDKSQMLSYIEKALAIAADMGIETAVFGNGGARKIPDGSNREATWSQLRDIVEMMDPIAQRNNVTVVVEPLNQLETDMINSYTDAVKLTEGAKSVAAMCDWYHVFMEGQTLEDLFKYPKKLRHLHIAYGRERLIPSPTDDMNHYGDFAKAVKKLGYNDKLSVEGGFKKIGAAEVGSGIESEATDIKMCIDTLKKLFV